jgi:hypothetical protein
MSSDITTHTAEYHQWLGALKTRYRQVQLKAAVSVNTTLLQFYWELGADIAVQQTQHAWGSGFLAQLSTDLGKEFPGIAGFSKRNLEQIRRWYAFWNQSPAIAQQAASQLMGILLLRTQKNHEMVQFALAGMANNLFVSRYQLGLPATDAMEDFLRRAMAELGGDDSGEVGGAGV